MTGTRTRRRLGRKAPGKLSGEGLVANGIIGDLHALRDQKLDPKLIELLQWARERDCATCAERDLIEEILQAQKQ